MNRKEMYEDVSSLLLLVPFLAPALLVLLSFLIVTPFSLRSLTQAKTVAIILLLAVPVVIDEVGKRNILLGLGGSLLLTILAAAMLSWKGKKPSGLSPPQ